MPCKAKSIEHSHTSLPYPKLHVYAPSLLDTWIRSGLDDLVDGMNLTLEWREANLDLEGTIDAEWGLWKADAVHDGQAQVDQIPLWCSDPDRRRNIWEATVSTPKPRRTDSAINSCP